ARAEEPAPETVRRDDAERAARRPGERHRRGPDLARQQDPERREARVVQAVRPDEGLERPAALEQIHCRGEHLAMMEDVDLERLEAESERRGRQRAEERNGEPCRQVVAALRRAGRGPRPEYPQG